MLSQILKEEIETYYAQAKLSNPLYVNAERGKLTSNELTRYVSNVLYLIQHTPVYLKLAELKSREYGMDKLAAFYREKLGEESGHDKWAEEDLDALKKKAGIIPHKDLSSSILALVDYLRQTIENDPSLYLPYILFAEYFTVLAGPSWVANLEKKCGISPKMMSVVGNHAELDKDHVQDDLKAIDALVTKEDVEPFLDVLKISVHFYEGFCSDVGTVGE